VLQRRRQHARVTEPDYSWKFRRNPASGHRIVASSPFRESVMYVVRISARPKQMLVGCVSGIFTERTMSPWGEKTVMASVNIVVTAMLPEA
jgi:hypothetical protein